MNRRYFVTYRHWNGNETENANYAFGRFPDQDSAERCARGRYVTPIYEILNIRPETDFEAKKYIVYRYFIRSLRIIFAIALGIISFGWLGDSSPKFGEIPLGNLTLNMIMSTLLNGALVIGAAWLCWTLAFGDGPQDDKV